MFQSNQNLKPSKNTLFQIAYEISNIGSVIFNIGNEISNIGNIISNIGSVISNIGNEISNIGEAILKKGCFEKIKVGNEWKTPAKADLSGIYKSKNTVQSFSLKK